MLWWKSDGETKKFSHSESSYFTLKITYSFLNNEIVCPTVSGWWVKIQFIFHVGSVFSDPFNIIWKERTHNTSPTTHFDVDATATRCLNSFRKKFSIDFLPHGVPMKNHHFTACRALQKRWFSSCRQR